MKDIILKKNKFCFIFYMNIPQPYIIAAEFLERFTLAEHKFPMVRGLRKNSIVDGE